MMMGNVSVGIEPELDEVVDELSMGAIAKWLPKRWWYKGRPGWKDNALSATDCLGISQLPW